MDAHTKHWIDWVSISTTLASLAGWLPAIAALASLVWSLIRIYETATVQRWLGKDGSKSNER